VVRDRERRAAKGALNADDGSGGVGSDQGLAPYLDALLAYAERNPGRFHIPGHKGGPGAAPALADAIGERALSLDIPALIEGIDVGPDPTHGSDPTPFEQSQRLAAAAWGARRSWFLINGASQGNLAACLTLRHAGRRVVMQRNVHSSTIDGVILAGLEPVWIAPELDPELELAHCITPDALEQALGETPDAVGAIAVSPTYFGAVADVRGLANVAHARGIPLIVDEAWGAHLRFSDLLPESALEAGADLVNSSVHKIIGSLTQSAILHLGHGELLDEAVVDRTITLLESTSPSALLAGSLDAARRFAALDGDELLSETIAALDRVRAEVRELPGLDVLDERLTGAPGVHAYDPLRLAVDVRGTGVTGYRIADELRRIDDINLELAMETVIVAMFGMGENAEHSATRLVAALRKVTEELGTEEREPAPPFASPPPWGPLEMPPRDAFLAPQEAVPFEQAEDRIAAESLAAYPPGVPNVLPGERISAETLAFIRDTLAGGGKLRGAVDRTLRTIRVVKES
jgi:arginine decarboxylase